MLAPGTGQLFINLGCVLHSYYTLFFQNFCWWLLTHLSPLYWFTDKGVYSQRKKSCVPGNWVLAQDLLKASLLNNKENHEESKCRHSLRCCVSLSYHWSANSDLILWLWDYFHKRLLVSHS